MQKLILDYSKWRCGGDEVNKLGKGLTQLLNGEGFMCCLGQLSLQLNRKLSETDILRHTTPYDVTEIIPGLSLRYDNGKIDNTRLSIQAIGINDNDCTTPDEKIKNLKELFKKNDYEIEVINMPKK